MNEKQYNRSIITQIIFGILLIINLAFWWFGPVDNELVVSIILCLFIDLREEIRQQFYKMKKENDEVDRIGKD